PGPFDKRVAPSVARNVAKAAMESGVARIEVDPQDVYDNLNPFLTGQVQFKALNG
ncbi:hypothetical protein, partial [Staphylococcus aureus]|uniref:hypothetical protein n=1 Tax=Staphylococcus aureus TaxID=1280 RepID=UPI0015C38FF4